MLPTIGGSHDYLDDVRPDPEDPFSPGLFVPAWDQGRVAVGNGAADSHWVHDDMEVSAVAFQEQGSRDVTVLVAANLYMIFGTDGDVIRERVADKIGAKRASRLQIAISADHNHHGPDTAFDVNHEWYDLMIEQASDAVVEAVDEMRPARLDVAETEHYFGLDDGRDPQVFDPTLGALRATATNGRTIATLLFWANHPETTLFWEPPIAAAEDAYFTADYPGWATRIIEDKFGGEALFFNGAIGGLVTPLGVERLGGGRRRPARARTRPAGRRRAAARRRRLRGAQLPPHLPDRSGAGPAAARCPRVSGTCEEADGRLRGRDRLHANVAHRLPAPARPR